MKKDFTGFVLAGGKSSRMGSDKFALTFDGETFLTRAARALSAVCGEVKIVLNQTQTIETGLAIVRDVYAKRGAPGGIHAALKNCATRFAVILAIDLPLVDGAALEKLVEIAAASNRYPAFVPRQTDGRAQPLCAVYRARYCLPPLEKMLAENQQASVRDLLDAIAPRYIDAARLSENENLLFNVNHPADYEKIN